MKTKSILRIAEYNQLKKLSIDGEIIDIGGSIRSGYHEYIGGTHRITTANIDESYGTDLIFDAQERWPVEEGSFDAVLLINVLEHLYKYNQALDETARSLKTGGMVVGVVPFMFNVHGSPNDYFRYTKSTIQQLFTDRNFTEVEVTELGTGAFSVIYHLLLGFIRWDWLAFPLIKLFTWLDNIVLWIKPNNLMSATYMPLGYFFTARKK
jgi:SAM-dependent methyltransferase